MGRWLWVCEYGYVSMGYVIMGMWLWVCDYGYVIMGMWLWVCEYGYVRKCYNQAEDQFSFAA